MLGYIFVVLGAYTIYATWSHNIFLGLVSGAVTLSLIITQYLIVAKNQYSQAFDDKNIVLGNIVASVIIGILFIVSFFVK